MQSSIELSEREIEILKLVATGVSNKEIARSLNISTNTVKVHLRNIFAKIGVLSRTEATLFAIEHRIVGSPGQTTEKTVGEETLARPLRITKMGWWLIGALTLTGILVTGYLLLPITPDQNSMNQPVSSNTTTLLRWQELAPMPGGRAGMATVVYENDIYLFAGQAQSGIIGNSLKYTVNSDHWDAVTDKPTPVTDIQAALIGEKIYIPGGWDGVKSVDKLEVFDPRSNTWEERSPLPEGRSGYGLATYEGRLFLFGGWDGVKANDNIFVYDPPSDKWDILQSMPHAIAQLSAVAVDSKVYLFGGWDGTIVMDSYSIFLPNRQAANDSYWVENDKRLKPICRSKSVFIANSIYTIGNSDECDSTRTPGSPQQVYFYQYLTLTDEWIALDFPYSGRFSPSIINYGEYLYIIGGKVGEEFSDATSSYHAVYTTIIPIFSNTE
jgi:DNA-binding CsgD family transcriptional regulator